MKILEFLRSPPPVHAFAVASEALAYGRLSRKRDALERVEVQPIAPPWYELGPVGLLQADRGALAGALGATLQRLDKPPARASLVVPDSWLRTIVVDVGNLPRRRPEAEDVVRWRLKKILPCRPEDVRLDYLPCGENGRILVALALDRPLATIEDLFAEAGVRLGRLEPVALALTALIPAASEPALLVVLDVRSLALVLRAGGRYLLVRHKTLPEDRERAAAFVAHELTRTVSHAREREETSGILNLWLAADDRLLEEVVEQRAGEEEGMVMHHLSPTTGDLAAAGSLPRVRLFSLLATAWGGVT